MEWVGFIVVMYFVWYLMRNDEKHEECKVEVERLRQELDEFKSRYRADQWADLYAVKESCKFNDRGNERVIDQMGKYSRPEPTSEP